MNRTIKLLLGSFLFIGLTQVALFAKESKRIQEMELDEHSVYTVPVSGTRITTISFPGPISAIDAAWITVDGKTPGLFHLAHKPGSYFFSVRSLVRNAVTNVNIRWNNRTYVLELQESAEPVLSWVFKYPNSKKAFPEQKAVTPSTLIGLLDKAKAFPTLKASLPEMVEQVDYVTFGKEPRGMDYSDFEVRLEEVFRFESEDTLVFRIILRNKTKKEIVYNPQDFSVRIGERLYFQSISDASGVMPPDSDSLAYFAITGTPNGGRNDISAKNEFTIRVARTAPVDPAPQPIRRPSSKTKKGSKK